MPLRIFECPTCGHILKTLKDPGALPYSCGHGKDDDEARTPMEEIISAPDSKMMETIDKEHGKSRLKDQQKILRERSRNHARDYEADELIQLNKANGIERSGFLNKNGKKRGKIDDL